jgi:ATP-dependent Clp protease, protease subunit
MTRISARLSSIFRSVALATLALLPAVGCSKPSHDRLIVASGMSQKPATNRARVVHLDAKIDRDLADRVKKELRDLDAAEPGKPITLVITSMGGYVPPGLDIIDTMSKLNSPVNTVCESWCTSMAAVIAASGDHRTAQPHAIFRFHEVQLDDDPQLRRLEQDELLDVLTRHSGTSKEAWEAVMRRGVFITAQQALALGALDAIEQPVRTLAPTPCI